MFNYIVNINRYHKTWIRWVYCLLLFPVEMLWGRIYLDPGIENYLTNLEWPQWPYKQQVNPKFEHIHFISQYFYSLDKNSANETLIVQDLIRGIFMLLDLKFLHHLLVSVSSNRFTRYYSHDTQVDVQDRKSICPDCPRQNMSMSKPPWTERIYVQTFVRSKIFLRSSSVQNTLYPDFRASNIT